MPVDVRWCDRAVCPENHIVASQPWQELLEYKEDSSQLQHIYVLGCPVAGPMAVHVQTMSQEHHCMTSALFF